MATVATGCVGQTGLVERRHLDQLGQLDPLHQQLGDPVAAVHDDRRLSGSRLISATLISPRYPASIVPGLLTIESPTRAAKPERGCTSPTIPCGIATAIPVGTRAR